MKYLKADGPTARAQANGVTLHNLACLALQESTVRMIHEQFFVALDGAAQKNLKLTFSSVLLLNPDVEKIVLEEIVSHNIAKSLGEVSKKTRLKKKLKKNIILWDSIFLILGTFLLLLCSLLLIDLAFLGKSVNLLAPVLLPPRAITDGLQLCGIVLVTVIALFVFYFWQSRAQRLFKLVFRKDRNS